jgi:outer membrane protein OmpA-like peptidoglycan-associated protein
MGALRSRLWPRIEGTFGAGTGLTTGYGTPVFRALVGLAFVADDPDVDSDGDGLVDRLDQCPNDPEDKDGFEDADGCSDPDNDKDGVLDVDDKCPMVPGVKEMQGCEDPDTDGDGIVDRLDKCVDVPGPQHTQGCPEKLDLIDGVYFETDKDVLLARSFPTLDHVAEILTDRQDVVRLAIEGHTDSDGSREHNLDLSQRRAQTVKKYLSDKGIAPDRLRPVGYGPDRPIFPNDSAENKAKNRRVMFVVEKYDFKLYKGTNVKAKTGAEKDEAAK